MIRAAEGTCVVMLENGLTLELLFLHGRTLGVWLLGDRWLCEVEVVAA